MSKLIAGFVFGVIVTLAVVFWLDEEPRATKSDLASQNSLPEETVDMRQASPVAKNDEAAEEGGDALVTPKSAEAVSTEEPPALHAQSIAASKHDARSTSPAQRSSATTAVDEYPPEIADMIANSVDKELQARYENDAREDSWAPYMEGLLAAYFAQKPSLAQFYFSLIDCRTSICEIHALGYGLDALTQWNTATADIVSQPWFEFNSMSMNRRNPEPDVLGIVLILTKKPPD